MYFMKPISLVFFYFIGLSMASDFNADQVLVLMVDNRELNHNFETNQSESYATRAAAINYEYAKTHNYSFALIRPEEMIVTKELQSKYGLSENAIFEQQNHHLQTHLGWAPHNKSSAGSFNVELKQFRASPWSRLPVIWFISKLVYFVHHHSSRNEDLTFSVTTETHTHPILRKWKYILYLDSDMIVNPSFHSQSLAYNLNIWRTHPKDRESKPFDETCLIFFSNAPYNNRPCTGGIVVDLEKEHTSQMFIDWWAYNDMAMNWVHEYEQEALHWMFIQPRRYTFKSYTTYLHGVTQFTPCDNQFFCHISNQERVPVFHHYTHNVLNWTQSFYDKILNEIERKHIFSSSLLPITELMAVKNETLLRGMFAEMSKDKKSLAHWLLRNQRRPVTEATFSRR